MITACRRGNKHLVSSIPSCTRKPLPASLILFRDQTWAVELKVKSACLLHDSRVCSHFRFTSAGFTAVKGWDPVSIQAEVRAHIFYVSIFFTGYGVRNAELLRTEKAR